MPFEDDYRQLHGDAALTEVMPRGLIAVSGRDRATYLQGLLTNDVEAIQSGSGCYAAWLTPQGRMTTDMHVLESGDMILLDVPAATTPLVLQRLEQFIFAEDVQLGDLSGVLRRVEVHGPRAAAVVASVLAGSGDGGDGDADGTPPLSEGVGGDDGSAGALAGWEQYHNARVAYGSSSIVIARIDQLGVPGYVLYVGGEDEAALRRALESHGASAIHADAAPGGTALGGTALGDAAQADAVTAMRIEAGYPLFGVDMDEEVIPLEAGIESRALSFTKGCYVGQEVVIRVLHRGHGRVVKKLVGLRIDGAGAVAAGSRIAAQGRDVGVVTSAAVSPALGPIALGYVHRDFIEPGTEVQVADVTVRRALVSALPMVR